MNGVNLETSAQSYHNPEMIQNIHELCKIGYSFLFFFLLQKAAVKLGFKMAEQQVVVEEEVEVTK